MVIDGDKRMKMGTYEEKSFLWDDRKSLSQGVEPETGDIDAIDLNPTGVTFDEPE